NEDYGGCTSWGGVARLPPGPPALPSEPALSDTAFTPPPKGGVAELPRAPLTASACSGRGSDFHVPPEPTGGGVSPAAGPGGPGGACRGRTRRNALRPSARRSHRAARPPRRGRGRRRPASACRRDTGSSRTVSVDSRHSPGGGGTSVGGSETQ